MPSATITAVAMRPTTTSVLPDALGYHSRKKSIVNSVAEALNFDPSEAISATIMRAGHHAPEAVRENLRHQRGVGGVAARLEVESKACWVRA